MMETKTNRTFCHYAFVHHRYMIHFSDIGPRFLTTILTGLPPISPINFTKTQQFQALFAPPQAPRQRPIQSWLATWTLARSFGRHRPLADTAMCNCFGKIWEGETTKTWCHRQNSCLVSDSMQAYLSSFRLSKLPNVDVGLESLRILGADLQFL